MQRLSKVIVILDKYSKKIMQNPQILTSRK